MKSKKMVELLIFWLPIIGGILLGSIAVAEWYSGDKIKAIWFGFGGIVCFLLVVTFQWQETLEKTSTKKEWEAQRAFVFINSFEVSVLGQIIRVMPRWENSGPTPTKDMHSRVSWKFFQGGLPVNFNYPDLDATGNEDRSTETRPAFIGPKTTNFAAPLDIPIFWIERVRNGEGRILIWGWVEYNDVFTGSPRHKTEFCNELIATGLPSTDPHVVGAAVTFPLYGPHNSAN